MAKRKAVAHVEHSEPDQSSDAEVAASAAARRIHTCITRLLEILARIERIPAWQHEDADGCLQRLRECKGVLLGDAEHFTRTEAVFWLHILRHRFFDGLLLQQSADETTGKLVTAFGLQIRSVLSAVAKKYERDLKELLVDQSNEWAELESAAHARDIRAGREVEPVRHADLFQAERQANSGSFSFWVAVSQDYISIDAELQRLANEYPEPECVQKINEVREAWEQRRRWAGVTGEGPDTVAVTTPPAAPPSSAKPVDDEDDEHDSAVTMEGTHTPEGAQPSVMLLSDAELADLAGCVTPQTLAFVRFLRAHTRSVFWTDLPDACWRNGSMPLRDSVETALERSRDNLSKVYQRWGLRLSTS